MRNIIAFSTPRGKKLVGRPRTRREYQVESYVKKLKPGTRWRDLAMDSRK